MRHTLSALNRTHDAVTTVGFKLAQFCLCVIVFAYGFETVARYFFASPTWWSNEIVAYALCIGTFLAFPQVSRKSGHITITFVTESLSPRSAEVARVVLTLVSAATCLLVAWICLKANIQQYVREELLVRVKPIPKVWLSVFMTYGFFSSGLYFLRQSFERSAVGKTKENY
ncbi:TRAP transporter small permease [Roseibium limicola]|uniref:TRAP transporter small permease protein n=1 Tax=Roseibium limicola TaxID=2816037 RepID=A0A939EKG9_9HYPH|nr:TRAP transporter small permease [Roseibium limicola]MBO0344261.1 TRAP transporter small permease [Roseibium limicola]